MANALLECNLGPKWNYVTDFYMLAHPPCEKAHAWLSRCHSAKSILAQHIRTEVEDIVKPYDERLKAAVAPVRVCLCTADAFAKLLAKVPAGPVSYAMMRFKKVEAACLDEAQSYEVDQAVACCKDLKTAIFMGDKNQTIVRTWPRWTRLPWGSHDDGQEVQATKAPVPECEPLDDDDINAAAGPGPPRATKNPEPRFITEWLTQASVCQLRLTGSKRYGAQVCVFLQQLLPELCSELTAAADAPDTRLVHVYYDHPWEPAFRWQHRKPSASNAWQLLPVSRNQGLFECVTERVMHEVQEARHWKLVAGAGCPLVLVTCYLQRVAKPLRDFLASFLGNVDATFLAPYSVDAVKVVVLDSARGLTAEYVHVIRGERFVDATDQYLGIQGDPKREYIAYSRGRWSTTVWLQTKPFGWPGELTKPPKIRPSERLAKGQSLALLRNTLLQAGHMGADGKLQTWKYYSAQNAWANCDTDKTEGQYKEAAQQAWRTICEQVPAPDATASPFSDPFAAIKALVDGKLKVFFVRAPRGGVRDWHRKDARPEAAR